jgi:multiple sugar transport system ATP-binding protein
LPVTNRQVQLGALSLASPAGSTGRIVLGVRPEDLQPTAAAEGFPFVVRVAEPLGSHIMLTGESAGQRVRVIVPPEHPVRPGVTMHLRPRLDRVVWMDPASGAAVSRGEGRKLGTEAAGD